MYRACALRCAVNAPRLNVRQHLRRNFATTSLSDTNGLFVDRSLLGASALKFSKVLIAAKGESGCRVARTCREMGIQTVAVYCDADANSKLVHLAHEKYRIEKHAEAVDPLIELAKNIGAQAIHPGWSHLARSLSFVEQCNSENIHFIGPSPITFRTLQDDEQLRGFLRQCSIASIDSCVLRPTMSTDDILTATDKIKYPLNIRHRSRASPTSPWVLVSEQFVSDSDHLMRSLEKFKHLISENDTQISMEKCILHPRLIEYQVFADQKGQFIHLYDREITLSLPFSSFSNSDHSSSLSSFDAKSSRQPIVTESPCLNISEPLKERMSFAAVQIARYVRLIGAGTVQFILDAKHGNTFYFHRFVPHLTPTHLVTENCLEQDLVQWQLLVAAGSELPLNQAQVEEKIRSNKTRDRAHVMQAHVHAIDPNRDFLPSPGTIVYLNESSSNVNVRSAWNVMPIQKICTEFESTLGSVTSRAINRLTATQQLARTFSNMQIVGPQTNISFLSRLFQFAPFINAESLDHNFISQNKALLIPSEVEQISCPSSVLHLTVLGILLKEKSKSLSEDPKSPWNRTLNCWRMNYSQSRTISLWLRSASNVRQFDVSFRETEDGVVLFKLPNGQEIKATGEIDKLKPHKIFAHIGTTAFTATVLSDEQANSVHYFMNGQHYQFSTAPISKKELLEQKDRYGTHAIAPVSGRVCHILVKKGQTVQKGDPVAVLELMKMQHFICAPCDSIVDEVKVRVKQQVKADDVLVLLRKPEPLKIASLSAEQQKAQSGPIFKLLNYLGELVVNGPQTQLGTNLPPARITVSCPPIPTTQSTEEWQKTGLNLRDIYKKQGTKAFAQTVLRHKGVLITDTTMRDAHQSLLATRVRTHDLLTAAPFASFALRNAFSLEMWGGATFDVLISFLRECPWDRLIELRQLIPNIPFQMLLRGANAVGYTGYPDNVVYKFCDLAVRNGMDVFRVFDSLNYEPNIEVGCDSVRKAGGIVEATICYTGDLSSPKEKKYTLDYYLKLADKMVNQYGTDILGVKDMAGILKPQAARILFSALRKQYPNVPLHFHTHDTAGNGVASELAAINAGANIVDVAVDALSGMTSQPSMGALCAALENTPNETGIRLSDIAIYNDFWERTRSSYAPFECTVTMKSGTADVYEHQIPGGQYTNLQFQAFSLGLSDRFPLVKKAYAIANNILGDIIKVTPSSKVVGDLAQFMVQNQIMDAETLLKKADTLSFPASVVDFFQGGLGQPYGGFPEPLRTKILKGKKPITKRPGESLPPMNFEAIERTLKKNYPSANIRDVDVMSYALYPKAFEEYMDFNHKFGRVENLPTHIYFVGPKVGDEWKMQINPLDPMTSIRLVNIGPLRKPSNEQEITFQVDGKPTKITVKNTKPAADAVSADRTMADPNNRSHVGAPMPGKVVKVKAKVGSRVKKTDTLLVLTAMKLDIVVQAPMDGIVKAIHVKENDLLKAGELLVEIQ
eukprot:TRINITY_DN3258_c0_g1_i1.p1 TRINITY_DN3258_c0_g1~~TRINITY_DN3258_c0_g1_i1.p1  ORF type:complete len:1474 (+),score=254.65 TRINITY_DN3258_c0_g1_i1:175-4596(+)